MSKKNLYGYKSLRIIFDRQEEWLARLNMIDQAEEFLYSSMYFMQFDNYGIAYVDKLIEAKDRGVDVTLFIDSFGQWLTQNLITKEQKIGIEQYFQKMRNAGINLVLWPPRSIFQRCLGSGMHIKIQVSEKGKALFFSGSVSETAYGKWREMSVQFEGSIVKRLLREFEDLGIDVKKEHYKSLSKNIKSSEDVDKIEYVSYDPTADTHWLNPNKMNESNKVTEKLIEEINKAKTSLLITSIFFKPCPSLMQAILDAAVRGVKVEIFNSHKHCLGKKITLPWFPVLMRYKELMAAGIDVYENKKSEHTKLTLIDGKRTIIGSYNYEWAADDRISEAVLISNKPEVVKPIADYFNQARKLTDNKRIDESIFKGLGLKIQLQIFFLGWINRWF